MKLSSSSSSSSKPISSPSRVEKFPPPLMRFLRSNGGSRSRSGRRSRLSSSSPMFVIRKKNASSSSSSSTGIETTQTHEPSSPKVSCMGQVHVQRSSKSKSKSKQTPKCSSSSCRWIREALFCKCFNGGKKSNFSDWRRRCCLFFQFGYRRKSEIVEESVKTESRRQFTVVKYEETPRDEDEDEDEDEEEKEERVFASSSSTSTIPPKNALLLMRCRSDPCRNRFSGGFPSVVVEEKTELCNKIENEEKREDEEEIPTSEKEAIFIDSVSESTTDTVENEEKQNLGFCEGFENLSNGRKNIRIRNGGSSSSSRSLPLTLARCKSESETGYWNKRKKSSFDEKCPPLLL